MRKIKDIVVLPDFCSTGIWKKGRGHICNIMLEYKDLGIPDGLAKKLHAWVELYDKLFYPYVLGKIKSVDKKAVIKFNKMGVNLCHKLIELLPKSNIWYYETSCLDECASFKKIEKI